METCQAIILHQFKYAESSLIVKAFTREYGHMVFMVRGIRSAKSKKSTALFFPFSLVEISFRYQQQKEMQVLSSVKRNAQLFKLYTDMNKSALSIFLCEVLLKSLPHEINHRLYDCIQKAIITLDQTTAYYGNFHLVFLLKISEYLGFYPLNNFGRYHAFFHLEEGRFENNSGKEPFIANQADSFLLHQLLEAISQKQHLHISRIQRGLILDLILNLYRIHIPNFHEIKSLSIFKSLFEEE